MRFEATQKWLLAGEDLLPREGKREPCSAVDLGNAYGAAAVWRPLNRDLVAAHGVDIKSTLQRKGVNCFAGTLAHLAKRPERAGGRYAEFFFEFPPGGGFRILSVVQFPFRDRPGTKIAATPKRPAWMDEEDKNISLAVVVHQNASAHGRHADWSILMKNEQHLSRKGSTRIKQVESLVSDIDFVAGCAAAWLWNSLREWHLARDYSLDLHQRPLTVGGQ